MNSFQGSQIAMVMILLIVGGCSDMTPPVSPEIQPGAARLSVPPGIADLAGPWEYQDSSGKGIITSNSEGNGIYEWEEGRFETLSLENRSWTGVWIQEGNDQEGGFKLTFSDDALVAHEEWWNTRIGNDHDPLQHGGSLRMTRSSTVQISQ